MRIGFCLEPHDLAASKLAAGREKDWDFVDEMLRHEIVDGNTVQLRIETLPIPTSRKEFLKAWVSIRIEHMSAHFPSLP